MRIAFELPDAQTIAANPDIDGVKAQHVVDVVVLHQVRAPSSDGVCSIDYPVGAGHIE
jgi:hypothetical protein